MRKIDKTVEFTGELPFATLAIFDQLGVPDSIAILFKEAIPLTLVSVQAGCEGWDHEEGLRIELCSCQTHGQCISSFLLLCYYTAFHRS